MGRQLRSSGVRRVRPLVFVVEDDTIQRELVAALLREYGFRVCTAENGKEALELLDPAALPAVVLTDLEMPVMDGWALLTALRHAPAFEAVPVVVMTGTELTRPVDGARLLRKPLRPGLLLDAIGAQVPASGGGANDKRSAARKPHKGVA